MGISIRSRIWLDAEMQRKREARAAADAADLAEAEKYEAEFLDRQRAADFLGLSVHQFKRLAASGKGPACTKAGDSPQSPVRWPIAELRAWKAARGSRRS